VKKRKKFKIKKYHSNGSTWKKKRQAFKRRCMTPMQTMKAHEKMHFLTFLFFIEGAFFIFVCSVTKRANLNFLSL